MDTDRHEANVQKKPSDKEVAGAKRKDNVLLTENVLRFLVSTCFILMPRFYTRRNRKFARYLAMFMVFLHWAAVIGYVYCYEMFWSGPRKAEGMPNKTSSVLKSTQKYELLPQIPMETLLILLGLVASGAITVTLIAWYFHKEGNDFATTLQRNFHLIPQIKQEGSALDLEKVTALSKYEWLTTNTLLAVGIVNVITVLSANLATGTLFDFHGIRNFLPTTTFFNRLIYYISVTAMFWGFCCTVCACCLFHVMCRHLIAVVNHTQDAILRGPPKRDRFFELHETLVSYTEVMINKFKYWFLFHNLSFLYLVAAIVFGWVASLRRSNYEHKYIVNQIAGTIMICYKFAFPFISASLVTVKFKHFYLTLVRKNKFCDIPELVQLQHHFGFMIFGLQVTPSAAIVALISSFVGLLKFLSP